MKRRVELIISGRVQGVFYRRDAHREAVKRGLSGFVRNEDNGNVHAEVQGPDAAVGSFIRWCRQGPENARVEGVEVREIPLEDGEGFVVRY